MKALFAAQMRELDRIAIEERGIPSLQLMETASSHIVAAALETPEAERSCAVFVGSGNNGGDGVAAAAELLRNGFSVRVFLVGKREKATADFLAMERRLTAAGGRVEDFDPAAAEAYLAGCGLVIDAMFGIGLNSPMRGAAKAAAELINASGARVIAADVPSGVHADTGEILGAAVRADVTVTFSLPKPGLYLQPGCVCCGRVRVCDIGIPRDLLASVESRVATVDAATLSLPRRAPDAHKGCFGRDLILAGSVGFTGAPVLAARAASRAGAGLVYLGVPQEIYAITAVKCSEVMPFPLPGEDGAVAPGAFEALEDKLKCASVVLAGPGLGRSEGSRELVLRLLESCAVPLILDADGINALEGHIDKLNRAGCPVILTPHDGEFARLGGGGEGDRLTRARAFAEAHGCILILKGHCTITALPDGSAILNTTGGPALAKGGSGDVLAGILAAFIGQGFPLDDAAAAAVYVHGLAGDLCAGRLGEYSVTADDVTEAISPAIMSLMR